MAQPPAQALTILACQIAVPVDMRSASARDAHLKRIAALIDKALTNQACDLVLLPELSSVSYSRHCFERPALFAEKADGQSFKLLAPLAKKHACHILYGAPSQQTETKTESLHISQFLIDDQGQSAGRYDKLHIAQFGASMEKDYFQPGANLLVFEINGLRLAPMICYDMRFALLADELVRQHQVDVILHPVAFSQDASFYSWRAFVVTRALENQVYWLSLNRAGQQYGQSVFCPPWVDAQKPETVLGSDEALVYVEVNKQAIEQARHSYAFGEDSLTDYALAVDD